MSSTVSQTQVKTSVPKTNPLHKMDKPPQLIRTSSIQKIMSFNNYICSQQYYMLPAILNWFKSSEASAEKSVVTFRSILFSSLLYKFFFTGCKSVIGDTLTTLKTKNLKEEVSKLYSQVSNCFKSTLFLTFAVHLAAFAILAQLLVCVYLLVLSAAIPLGLSFLLVSFSYINFLFYKTIVHSRSRNRKTKLH